MYGMEQSVHALRLLSFRPARLVQPCKVLRGSRAREESRIAVLSGASAIFAAAAAADGVVADDCIFVMDLIKVKSILPPGLTQDLTL